MIPGNLVRKVGIRRADSDRASVPAEAGTRAGQVLENVACGAAPQPASMRNTAWMVVAGIVGAMLTVAPAALAKDGDVRVPGTCSRTSTSKLKLSREDGGTEVEFEVDQNRAGVRWRVVLVRNGTQVASRTRVTRPPSGSFEARFVTGGSGRFVARATSPTGETCTARAAMA